MNFDGRLADHCKCQVLIVDHDHCIRNVAQEGLGRLCSSSGNAFTTNEINFLIDLIVSNRDPSARAGCAKALGSIHSHVGGMAAGYHLKKVHGILLSLCNDPNPVVHLSAIEALSQVAESAGLAFSAYVSGTLGLLAQVWTSDSHNEESSTATTSNIELEYPTPVAVAHTIDSLINVLGPDLQDMSKFRELMLMLLEDFEKDSKPMVEAESLRCWEHINLYDPIHVNLHDYVHLLQANLGSPDLRLRDISIDGLYNLMRRDTAMVFEVANERLEDQIWLALNETPGNEGLRNVIQTWLGQSSLSGVNQWVTRCQKVLTKTPKR